MIKTRFFAPLAAIALLASGSAPAFAKAQDSQGSGASSTSASNGERTICKRFQNTASRLRSERLCLTKAQWKKFESEN